MKKVKVEHAVGMVLGHDVTKIIPGKFKGAAFKRGHRISESDIPELLDIGKSHVWVMELKKGQIHEEQAALRIGQAVAGSGLVLSPPKEGKVEIKADLFGLLKVNVRLLERINSIRNVVLSTLHTNSTCRPGMVVAGTKIIPLFIDEAVIKRVEDICHKKGKVLEVIPFCRRNVSVVITGREVFQGRIKDKFGDILQNKLEAFGATVSQRAIVPDDASMIAKTITEFKAGGSELIIVSGGMSVDPDDVTPQGIRKTGAKVIVYGAPVLPGSMFLYAKLQGTPIIGAPACVLHDPTTILDIILPRVLAGEDISRKDIIKLGHGGLCQRCKTCRFPVCPFGKGSEGSC